MATKRKKFSSFLIVLFLYNNFKNITYDFHNTNINNKIVLLLYFNFYIHRFSIIIL